MPTYHYRCPRCGTEYERIQKITDRTRAKCPECGARGEKVISGGAGVVFKGSGFYITDYKRAAESKPASADGAPKPDPAPKTDTPEKKAPSKPAKSSEAES